MPTTSNFQIDYPASTDLVKDGATNMATIANGFDSLLGTIGVGGLRNAIINSDMAVNQRVFSSTTVSGYGFDRWFFRKTGGTSSYSAQSFTPGSPAVAGYEAASYSRVVASGQSAAGDLTIFEQPIEDVRTFAGAQITVSFWARASAGTPSVAVELSQYFGTGGSPSADVNNYFGKVQLTTGWIRYQVTATLPNLSGKTIGTAVNSSGLVLRLWTSAGTNFNARTGSLGIQSATIDFWGVQVERGSRATPLERRPAGVELMLCQRYFEKTYRQPTAPGSAAGDGLIYSGVTSDGGGAASLWIRFAVPKRTTSFTITAWTDLGVGGNWTYQRSGAGANVVPTISLTSEHGFRIQLASGVNWTPVTIYGHYQCDAEY